MGKHHPARGTLPPLIAALLIVVSHSPSSGAAEGKLTVRVLDAATGQPMPARLVLRASDGTYPGDRLQCSAERWPHIEAHAVFIRGEETFELPAGNTTITAARGLEYRAETTAVELPPDGQRTVELRLERAVDMRRAGWVSGDLHMHMIHGENQRATSYDDVALTCSANGLHFACVAQEYVGAGTHDLAGYHAACRAVSTDDFQLFLGAERPKNLLGHLALLGVDNPFLIAEDPPYFQTAAAIHAQGGVMVYMHPVRYFPGKQWGGEWLDFPGNNLARELIFDAYAGPSFDGLSVLSDEANRADAHQLWFNLLNRGCFVPVFADSDACFDRPSFGLKAPGFWNTYFYIGPDAEVTPRTLTEAVRRGRTIATTGPLVQFQIDDQLSGSTLPLDGSPRTVTIQVDYPQHAFSLDSVDARSGQATVIERVELLRSGVVVQHWQPDTTSALISHTIQETQRSWYAVRVYGSDRQWQVALASPIYFAEQAVPQKQPPLNVTVQGRIYDFATGKQQPAQVEIHRHGKVLQQIEADGRFRIEMPVDAEIVVTGDNHRPLRKNLLMDYGPVHRMLWYLESEDLGKMETFERFELLLRNVQLEFPLGFRLPGSYFVQDLAHAAPLEDVSIVSGPERVSDGAAAVAAVLLDTEQIAVGDAFHIAAIFRDEGQAQTAGPCVVEVRGYDPQRPSGFGALKKFATLESNWNTATDLGDGYKLVAGKVQVPMWVEPGPTGAIDVSVRVRQDHSDAAFIGLAIPIGPTKRALSLSNSWPTMPLSWPDRSYGIGPLKLCNRLGRKGSPQTDYRTLQLRVMMDGEAMDLNPARDTSGAADAHDAVYQDHFFDQILAEESMPPRR